MARPPDDLIMSRARTPWERDVDRKIAALERAIDLLGWLVAIIGVITLLIGAVAILLP